MNTAASILLASYPAMAAALSGITGEVETAVVVFCCIVSTSAVHSFVPSMFTSAPDPDEALSVLSERGLLAEGRAWRP